MKTRVFVESVAVGVASIVAASLIVSYIQKPAPAPATPAWDGKSFPTAAQWTAAGLTAQNAYAAASNLSIAQITQLVYGTSGITAGTPPGPGVGHPAYSVLMY